MAWALPTQHISHEGTKTMHKIILPAAALAAAAFGALPASAVVINFDDFAGSYTQGPDYYESGYKLSVSLCGATSACFRAVDAASSIDPDGTSVVRGGGATTVTVQREDGGLFEFVSMDFGKTTAEGRTASSTYEFVFTLEDATTLNRFFTFNHNNPAPIVAHTAAFADIGLISSFTFRNASTAAQFDNIVLNELAPVPEPASWAMMIAGFGLAGGAMRRRRAVLRFA